MGTYYYLINDSAEEILSLDSHVKEGPHRFNPAVHMAYINYMLEHEGDKFRLLPDNGNFDECIDNGYEEIDLLFYHYEDEEVIRQIVKILNEIYGGDQYVVRDGVGARA